jgi:N-acetyltransferase
MGFVGSVPLLGDVVQLRPLERTDRDELISAAGDGELWKLFYTRVPSPERMEDAIETFLRLRDQGTMMPFTVRLASTGRVVGMTTFCNIDAANRRLEIGYTWFARSSQGTGVNAASKLLMLGHAFDELGCIAVEFRTHWMNQRSRRAIERLGAKQDGMLRSHQLMADGSIRDTVVFSIIASEWPTVRNELHRRLS